MVIGWGDIYQAEAVSPLSLREAPGCRFTSFRCVDVGMMCRWTRGFSDKPAREHTHIAPFLQRMLERPAMQRAISTERLSVPLV